MHLEWIKKDRTSGHAGIMEHYINKGLEGVKALEALEASKH
jgi:hypothetical protein